MYADNSDADWLYPGDIIRDLELPDLKLDAYRLQPYSGNESKQYSVRLIMNREFFVFLSHECDCNDGKIQFFILSPMIHIDAGLRRAPEQFRRLIDSNDVVENPHYLNLFYFSDHAPIFPKDMLIDFTRLISYPSNCKEELLRNKVIQLDENNRTLIKNKMAYYFARQQDPRG